MVSRHDIRPSFNFVLGCAQMHISLCFMTGLTFSILYSRFSCHGSMDYFESNYMSTEDIPTYIAVVLDVTTQIYSHLSL